MYLLGTLQTNFRRWYTNRGLKSKPWYNDHIYGLRKLTRQNEEIWRCTGLEKHRQIFREQRNNLTDCITQAKIKYDNKKLAGADQRTAFQVLSQLVEKTDHALPEDSNGDLCDKFATLFDEKITKIPKDIDNVTVPLIEPPPVRAVRTENLSFLPLTSREEIIMACKSKSCCLDVIPTDILKKNLSAYSQIIPRLVNISFTTGEFPQVLLRQK